MADWRRALGEAVGQKAAILLDEPMARHTTFRIGGPADAWVEAPDEETLLSALRVCADRGTAWWILGRGSNALVSDQGLRGIVICLAGGFRTVRREGDTVRAGGAALLDDIAETASRAGISGFEFLAGIPGTVGGGLATNAGAFGLSLSDVIRRVKAMDRSGRVVELGGEQLSREYRSPVIERGLVALEATMRPANEKGSGAREQGSVDDVRAIRRARQPKEPSAGSFFKNPAREGVGDRGWGIGRDEQRLAGSGERIPAGQLIEECGLKGRTVGGAQVSRKHANFIVNTGSARFCDVYELAQIVKAVVEERTGIILEEEVRALPETQEVS